jgi:hypothetical protein
MKQKKAAVKKSKEQLINALVQEGTPTDDDTFCLNCWVACLSICVTGG